MQGNTINRKNNLPGFRQDERPLKKLSPELSDIISYQPGWIVRNGIMLFLLVICLLLFLTFFISYPDVVTANARFTSINAPKEVKAKVEGMLVKLNAKEGMFVGEQEVLAFMESRAKPYEVLSLLQLMDSMQQKIESNNTEGILKYRTASYRNLGEVQQAFQTFMQSYHTFAQYLSRGYFLKKKSMLNADLRYLERLHRNLSQQKIMQEEDLALAQQTLEANKSLDADKVISPLDYRNEKSKFISKALNIPQVSAAIINNEGSRHEKLKEIAQIENEIAQQKEIFIQALHTCMALVEEWKSKYVLTAPCAGKIAFAGFLQENQQVKMNQVVCYVNPGNSSYFAEISITQNNFGKIAAGQKVMLKLPAYPFQEFGALEGRLAFISRISTDSGYLAKVSLPDGLETNYNIHIQYHEGLRATGEIITADTKLSDRLLNPLKSLLHR